jgi:hypothetical protein
MSETAIEDHVADFLQDAIDAAIIAAVDGDLLIEADLHDTVYRPFTKPNGIRVGNAQSVLAPNSGQTEVLEFDARLPIIIFSRVEKDERTDRKRARGEAVALAKRVTQLLLDDPTLGGRVNDARVPDPVPRDFDNWDSKPYAVAEVGLLINES